MGRVNYEGKIKHPFTAHPKIDPQTGEGSFCVQHLRRFAAWLFSTYSTALVNIHPGIACAYLTFVAYATWSVHSSVGKPLLFSSAWYKQTPVLIHNIHLFICSICK